MVEAALLRTEVLAYINPPMRENRGITSGWIQLALSDALHLTPRIHKKFLLLQWEVCLQIALNAVYSGQQKAGNRGKMYFSYQIQQGVLM